MQLGQLKTYLVQAVKSYWQQDNASHLAIARLAVAADRQSTVTPRLTVWPLGLPPA